MIQFSESIPDNYDDEAINSALQRLSVRQQRRQYSAAKGAGLLHKEPEGEIMSSSGETFYFIQSTVFTHIIMVCHRMYTE